MLCTPFLEESSCKTAKQSETLSESKKRAYACDHLVNLPQRSPVLAFAPLHLLETVLSVVEWGAGAALRTEIATLRKPGAVLTRRSADRSSETSRVLCSLKSSELRRAVDIQQQQHCHQHPPFLKPPFQFTPRLKHTAQFQFQFGLAWAGLFNSI